VYYTVDEEILAMLCQRAGLVDLNEGQKVAYEVVADRRTGKSSADNLKPL